MKTTLKAIIVEDSRLARKELQLLLKEYQHIKVIGEAENVDDAFEMINTTFPDILFLDINMPEKDGFELLEMLDEIPKVIFTTAYDEYAIKSFEYNAFDYLLKPINKDRLQKTIDRIEVEENVEKNLNKQFTLTSQVFLKDGEDCWMVAIQDITLFEIVGNYTRVYFKDKKPLIYKSLNKIESRLPTNAFFRVNRQQIVNLNHIKNVTPWFNGKLKFTMINATEVEVSRRQSVKFKQELEL
ncbi:LytTR family DNA-binding domain-containing protein [uncultured Tenacibaculum sp.]|uniref:LytR/AlgR family response regulator transcription factor n=1 Tax=uncultured Tenacibaculum sp. TaxID=174713 RepID=UPI00261D5175|nr:LytTR family DNA-binding domain-containing protein [uncultured Tenacibaculum sp.]